jgi:hypothetical protein
MHITTHSARITGPVAYRAAGGTLHHIPIGPCLLELIDQESIDVIWGPNGQSSAALPVTEIQAAHEHGNLELLD